MKMLRTLGGLIIVGLFCFSFGEIKENRLVWNEGKVVQWMDFEGVPDYGDNFRDAVTASALNYKVRCLEDGTMTVSVSAEFVKDKSWVKEVARTDYHLGHERLHFDLTELYVRKMRKQLEGRVFKCSDEHVIDNIAAGIMKDWRDAQIQYDKETAYSLNKKNQKIWHGKVAKEMIENQYFATKTK